MSRTKFTITSSWVEVNSSLPCVVTFSGVATTGNVQFNDVNNNPDTVTVLVPRPNDQISQNESKPLFMRSDSVGYTVIVDGGV